MPLIHCSSTLYYHRATVPLFYLTLLLLRHCSTVPPHFTTTAPLFHCSPTLYYRCATPPVFLHTLLSLRHCSTVPPHFTITVPLFHCSFTLNYHCFTASLLHCSSTVYYSYGLPVRWPYVVITRARIDAIKRVCSELPCCPGPFLDLLSVHDNFGDENGILRDILLPKSERHF